MLYDVRNNFLETFWYNIVKGNFLLLFNGVRLSIAHVEKAEEGKIKKTLQPIK